MSKIENPSRPRLAVHTLGCKVNQFESACLIEQFQAKSWIEVPFKDQAELFLINTCTVTAEAQRQSTQMVRQAVRRHSQALIIVTGCAAQLFPQVFEEIPGVDHIVGTFNKFSIPDLISSLTKEEYARTAVLPEPPGPLLSGAFPLNYNRTRAFLRIQDGCNAGCSYCLVPQARGSSRSLAQEEVHRGIRALAAQGFKEVILTGIHLGQYGQDLSPATDLVSLLATLLEERPEIAIRLSSLEAQEVSPELIALFKSRPNLCPHLHIPLQSGDDFLLRRMNRGYTREEYRHLIQALKRELPRASIGTDIIVGFPGEDEQAFRQTLDLVRDLPLSYLHLFPYSPRPGTLAALFRDQVPGPLKKKRLEMLREIDRLKRQEFAAQALGQVFSALVLKPLKEKGGYETLTENYLTVRVEGNLRRNDRVRIRLTAFGPQGIRGEVAA